MSQIYGIEYLRNKLAVKKTRVKIRYDFYEMKNKVRDFQISTPPSLKEWVGSIGWCAKAVDTLADRLIFREFDDGDNKFNINEIFKLNNPDVFFDSAILSALISSCCFVYISGDDKGYPRLQVIDGANATGCINPITGLLTEGYAILEKDKNGKTVTEAYFVEGRTEIYRIGEREPEIITNNAGHPLLVPIVFRPDAVREFGRSRISRACMSIVGSALRTIKRSEISAEFYSFPQKYVLGTDPDQEPLEKWKASMSSLIEFTKDEDGDVPTMGQFSQQSMSPHIEQLRMFAALFAGETGLTLDDLGFVTDNPSSAEAIKASHENLRLLARKAQRNFGSGFLNVGYVSACFRDDFNYERKAFYKTSAEWEPIFEPDSAMLSAIGDGVIKINQAVPDYISEKNLRNLTGIKKIE